MSDTATPVDAASDFGSGRAGQERRWQAELRACMRDPLRVEWLKRCEEIECRYREMHDEGAQKAKQGTRFNSLWSNVQTLLPAYYVRPPVPVVSRRFKDSDPVARAASMILQRALIYEIDEQGLHQLIRKAVLDFILTARGVVWARFEPNISDDDEAGDDGSEEVEWDFVHRDDFFQGPGGYWRDVPWVGRRVRMTRAAGIKRFGRRFRDVNMSWVPHHVDASTIDDRDEVIRRAEVVEIWDKESGRVRFFGDPFGEIIELDDVEDPLHLRGFFPCPEPLLGTTTTDTLIPVPDYIEYQDQAKELDDLTARIAGVSASIRVRFAFNGEYPELQRIFDEDLENQGIALTDWMQFQQSSGMDGAMSFVPLEPMIKALSGLIEARAQVKTDLNEVTGISDILRGASDPRETATAQSIKGRYATLRLLDRQLEVARYVRDVLRITGEIMCEHFSPETLRAMSNFDASDIAKQQAEHQQPPMAGHNGGPPMPPQMPMQQLMAAQMQQPSIFDQAIALLRNDKLRGFKIDIEDQSTVALDEQEEKASRVEFLAAVGKFISGAVQLPPMLAPALLPLLGRLLLFGARAFRVGLEMESAIENATERMASAAEQAQQNPPPNPDMIKAQADQARVQIEAQKAQAEIQLRQAEMQGKAAQAQQQAQEAAAERAARMQEMQQAASQAAAQNAQDATQHQIAIHKAQLDEANTMHQQRMDIADHAVDAAKIDIERQRLALEAQALAVQAAQALNKRTVN